MPCSRQTGEGFIFVAPLQTAYDPFILTFISAPAARGSARKPASPLIQTAYGPLILTFISAPAAQGLGAQAGLAFFSSGLYQGPTFLPGH